MGTSGHKAANILYKYSKLHHLSVYGKASLAVYRKTPEPGQFAID